MNDLLINNHNNLRFGTAYIRVGDVGIFSAWHLSLATQLTEGVRVCRFT
jgi:hypothetical protein